MKNIKKIIIIHFTLLLFNCDAQKKFNTDRENYQYSKREIPKLIIKNTFIKDEIKNIVSNFRKEFKIDTKYVILSVYSEGNFIRLEGRNSVGISEEIFNSTSNILAAYEENGVSILLIGKIEDCKSFQNDLSISDKLQIFNLTFDGYMNYCLYTYKFNHNGSLLFIKKDCE